MNYEVITLEKKTLVGLTAHTGNKDPQMGAVIGGLWQSLFEGGTFFTINNKINEYSIGLYSGYNADDKEEYDITVGCEVSTIGELPPNTVVKDIPSGKYAKFVIFGDMVEAVVKAWSEIATMDLQRTFTGDFEEYRSTEDSGDAEICIYVAIQ